MSVSPRSLDCKYQVLLIMSLTADQVDTFLTKKLGISDWKQKLVTSNSDLFFQIERQFKQAMYYETIVWGAQPYDQLASPTIEEACHLVLENGGGACLQLNHVIHLVFKYLGYDTFVIATQTIAVNLPRNHNLVIVRFPQLNEDEATVQLPGFNTHDYYLVDVGCVRPFPGPILLNKLPHVYKSGGLRIEHRFNTHTAKFELLVHGGDPLRGPYEDVSYKKYCEFDLTPHKFEDFNASMTQIFTNPEISYFLNTISMSRFLKLESKEDHLFVNFMGRTMTMLTESNWKITKFDSYMEMAPAINKYFPGLNQAILLNALANYEERQIKFKQT